MAGKNAVGLGAFKASSQDAQHSPFDTSSQKTLQLGDLPDPKDPNQLSPQDRKKIRVASPRMPKGKGSGTPKAASPVEASVAPADVAAGHKSFCKALGTHKRKRSPSPSNIVSRMQYRGYLALHIWHVDDDIRLGQELRLLRHPRCMAVIPSRGTPRRARELVRRAPLTGGSPVCIIQLSRITVNAKPQTPCSPRESKPKPQTTNPKTTRDPSHQSPNSQPPNPKP